MTSFDTKSVMMPDKKPFLAKSVVDKEEIAQETKPVEKKLSKRSKSADNLGDKESLSDKAIFLKNAA